MEWRQETLHASVCSDILIWLLSMDVESTGDTSSLWMQ